MQDEGPDAFRMLAQIDHRCLGSVRHAEEIEPRISEPAADLVQIDHCERSRVIAQVGLALQLLAATADRRPEAGLVPILRIRGIPDALGSRARRFLADLLVYPGAAPFWFVVACALAVSLVIHTRTKR